MQAHGANPSGNTPDKHTRLTASKHVKWAKVVKYYDAKAD